MRIVQPGAAYKLGHAAAATSLHTQPLTSEFANWLHGLVQEKVVKDLPDLLPTNCFRRSGVFLYLP